MGVFSARLGVPATPLLGIQEPKAVKAFLSRQNWSNNDMHNSFLSTVSGSSLSVHFVLHGEQPGLRLSSFDN